ncbi:MAG: L-serine ammonia-lyase, iron-sulfur-dependent subunit beta [Cyclobacteriaceae bacterium]|nr:L-serine ammonia-lyase, iron-sulfur-dependent subunit beta [Cyclobacteriaceae bacterium]
MAERSSVFDMIGPIMIGPSSSHTAGVVRIARVAFRLLKTAPQKAEITFYNSFARTYEGHGSDKAAIAGLLDFKTDDKRIKESFEHAQKKGLDYKFKSVGNASNLHPNTIKLKLTAKNTETTIIGESLGGGVINISEVNGYKAHFSARLHTLIITADDVKGTIAFISNILSNDDCNIATMTVSRKGKHDVACHIVEMDSGLKPITLEYLLSLDWVHDIVYIPDIDL